MKHLIEKSLLLLLTLSLIACDKDSENGSVTFTHPDPTSNTSAQDFFSALQRSENRLNTKYRFNITVKNNGRIDHTDLSQSDFRQLARRQNTTLQEIKSQFFEDVYHFSLNYITLKDRESALRNYNNDLFNIYISKTFEIGQIFSVERIEYYNRRSERLTESFEEAGLKLHTIWNLGQSSISLPLVDIVKLRQAPTRLYNQLNEATKVCSKLEALQSSSDPFSNNGISVTDCTPESSILYFIDALKLANLSNQNTIRPREIKNTVRNYTDVKTLELHQIANYFLGENMIYILHNSPTGLDMNRRRPWVRSIRQSYPNTAQHIFRIAKKNNLYTNLLFKKKVIRFELISNQNLSPAERQQHRGVISTIDRIIGGIQYDPSLNFDIGISPVDGILFNY